MARVQISSSGYDHAASGHNRRLWRTSNGTLIFIFFDDRYDLAYQTSTDDGVNWSSATSIETSSDRVDGYYRNVFDSYMTADGDVGVVYQDLAHNVYFRLLTYNSTAKTFSVGTYRDTGLADVYATMSIGVTYGTAEDQWYAVRYAGSITIGEITKPGQRVMTSDDDGATWTEDHKYHLEHSSSNYSSSTMSLYNGYPFIIYTGYGITRYVYKTSSGWQDTAPLESTEARYQTRCDIVSDDSGNVYWSNGHSTDIDYWKWTGSWTQTVGESEGPSSTGVSIQADGTPWYHWIDSSSDIRQETDGTVSTSEETTATEVYSCKDGEGTDTDYIAVCYRDGVNWYFLELQAIAAGSPSSSISPSPSPSSSVSLSVSPSSSTSLSLSPSSSVSASFSPSASVSPSSSESLSVSPSSSVSSSTSLSVSPSSSSSLSISPSASISPSSSSSLSLSPSSSVSPSPSAGTTDYSKGDYAALPGNATDLENIYTAQQVLDVETKNDIRVSQTASGEYAIHQYGDFVTTGNTATLEWEGQTNLTPSLSTVYLQIYNFNSTSWELVDSDNSSAVDTDFALTGNIPDLTNYKDGSMMYCRIYQLGT